MESFVTLSDAGTMPLYESKVRTQYTSTSECAHTNWPIAVNFARRPPTHENRDFTQNITLMIVQIPISDTRMPLTSPSQIPH